MFNVIISSSVLIILVIMIRALFRERVSNALIYALWLLVVVRLVMPVPEFVAKKIIGWNESKITSCISIMNVTTRVKDSPDNNFQHKADDICITDTIYQEILKYILYGIWFAGFAVIIAIQILSEKKLRRQLLENRQQMDAVQRIYVTDSINTPALFRSSGIKLDIYIPLQVVRDREIIKYAILHENIHKKHGDIWWSYIRNILVAVYWFNPLVWTAAILSKRDAEYACDSGVIKAMDKKERIAYGNSLLSLVQSERKPDIFCTAASMYLIKTEMEERIIMIKKGIKNSITATSAVCLAVVFAAAITFTEAKADSNSTIQETLSYNKDIVKAKKAVEKYVNKRNRKDKYEYCDMKNLHYDKEYSSLVLSNSKDMDKMIVLLSEVDMYYKISENDTSTDIMIDGSKYPNWMWILKQDNNGNWIVKKGINSISESKLTSKKGF